LVVNICRCSEAGALPAPVPAACDPGVHLDGADEALDWTVLVDNFAWSATPGATVTDRPPPVL
jgi:hypothetical protein